MFTFGEVKIREREQGAKVVVAPYIAFEEPYIGALRRQQIIENITGLMPAFIFDSSGYELDAVVKTKDTVHSLLLDGINEDEAAEKVPVGVSSLVASQMLSGEFDGIVLEKRCIAEEETVKHLLEKVTGEY